MPAGNRTGHIGQGPVTGRGLGYCTGYETPGFTKGLGARMGRAFGLGSGFGMGRGMSRGGGVGRQFRGFASEYYPPYHWMQEISKEDELEMLRTQAEDIKKTQSDIEKRIKELEQDKEK